MDTARAFYHADDPQPSIPPPPYDEVNPDDCVEFQHKADCHQTFDRIEAHIACDKHNYEIWQDAAGLVSIHRDSCIRPTYHVDMPAAASVPHVSISRPDGTVLARARPVVNGTGLEIKVCGSETRCLQDEWTAVQRIAGGILKHDVYRFTSTAATGLTPLAWKRTHRASNGSSKFAVRNFKLVDESEVGRAAPRHGRLQPGDRIIVGGDTLATFVARGSSRCSGGGGGGETSRHLVGRVQWRDDLGEEFDLTALVSLLAVLQVEERHVKGKFAKK